MADFRFIPEPIPPRGGGGRPTIYLQMLTEFVQTGEQSVRIEYKRKPDTIYNGLASALRKHPEVKGVAVVRRGGEVYLARKK
jgi:hypothetical protein